MEPNLNRVWEVVITDMAPKFMVWWGTKSLPTPTDLRLVFHISDAFDLNDDGYAMAKRLEERHQWPSDSRLVVLLDETRAKFQIATNILKSHPIPTEETH